MIFGLKYMRIVSTDYILLEYTTESLSEAVLQRYEGTKLRKHWVRVIYEARGTDVVQD